MHCRFRQTASLVSAGILSQARSIHALENKVCREHSTDLLIQAAGTITLAAIGYVLFKILKKVYYFCAYPHKPSLNPELHLGYPAISLALESVSGTERVMLPMATVNGIISKTMYIGHLQPRILGYRGNLCGGALAISLGSEGPGTLQCGSVHMKVPETVSVPWQLGWKVRRISQGTYRARVWSIDQFGIAYLLKDSARMLEPATMSDFVV